MTDSNETVSSAETDEPARPSAESGPRNRLLRDAAVFQGKLILDGLRDVVLFPAALIAVAVDFFKKDEPVGKRFYDVLHFGQQTEHWIDLFEAVERAPETEAPRPTIDVPSLDDFIDELERKLKAEYEKGDVAASAREAVDRAIDAVRAKR